MPPVGRDPGDPCLTAGLEKTTHKSKEPVTFKIEADWTELTRLTGPAGQPPGHASGAYWLRLVSDKDTSATAQFSYH